MNGEGMNVSKLDNIIEKKIDIDEKSDQDIFDWAEHNNYINLLKDTEFFYDVERYKPYLNRHTLKSFMYERDSTLFLYELSRKFEQQYNIHYMGISRVPNWIDGYDDDKYLIQHKPQPISYDIGMIRELNHEWYYCVEEGKYELVDVIKKDFRVEFEPIFGRPVYYELDDEPLLIWEYLGKEDDDSSEEDTKHWEF